MRISTAGMHNAALRGILERNATLVKTQNQIASGKRIQTPADDPVGRGARARARSLARGIEAVHPQRERRDQPPDARGAGARRRHQSPAPRARPDAARRTTRRSTPRAARRFPRKSQSRLQELMGIANRKDATGEYLFSGFSTLTQPFVQHRDGRRLHRRPGRALAADQPDAAHPRRPLRLRDLPEGSRRQRHVRHLGPRSQHRHRRDRRRHRHESRRLGSGHVHDPLHVRDDLSGARQHDAGTGRRHLRHLSRRRRNRLQRRAGEHLRHACSQRRVHRPLQRLGGHVHDAQPARDHPRARRTLPSRTRRSSTPKWAPR